MPPSLHPSPSASRACFQQRRRGAFAYPGPAEAWWTGSAPFWESTESVPFSSPRDARGRTSGQTRGPGRQAVKNRPWECLSLHDSASAGPGGRAERGGLWRQEASSGPRLSSGSGAHVGPAGHLGAGTPDRPCWPPALAGDILTPVHTEEGARRLGRWALGGGFENGREKARGKCHSVWRWGAVCPALRGRTLLVDSSAVTRAQPCLHQFSWCLEPKQALPWGPSPALSIQNSAAGQGPARFPSGSPAEPGWHLRRRGRGSAQREGERVEVALARQQ